MDVFSLQDKLYRGSGTAARKLGMLTTVYRPTGSSDPIGEHQRVIKIYAAFDPQGQTLNSSGTESPTWHGIFDASYTRQADYMVSPQGTFFIGSQIPGMPVICIRTNRIISMYRPTFTMQGGYSGFLQTDSQITLLHWPVCVVRAGGSSTGEGPNNHGFGTWTILLPPLSAAPISTDVITDDLGSTFVVDHGGTESTRVAFAC